jgi:2-C-methyl-D-erythritol 4-phosphate cytidylyltransferase
MKNRFHALVPCAGIGARAGAVGPKQYTRVGARTMVGHTLEALVDVARLDSILVVLAPDDTWFEDAVDPVDAKVSAVRCGGPSRAVTVANGLAALTAQGADDADWVLVHDAARCLVRAAWIDRLIDACADDEVGGLLALPVADTLKQADGDRVAATIPRAHKWAAQTPQMFRLGLLRRALDHAGAAVTDESSAVEALGLHPRLVPGDAENFKLTWPADFALAERVLAARRVPERPR